MYNMNSFKNIEFKVKLKYEYSMMIEWKIIKWFTCDNYMGTIRQLPILCHKRITI